MSDKRSVDDTLNYYNSKAKDFVSSTVNVSFTKIQDVFLEHILPSGRILDFGCGSGRDTKYFLSKGYKVDAIDGVEELCKIASEYTGISVKHILFEELYEVEVYDGIWACASILHVEKDKLPDIFKRMINALKTDGIIYTSFKYGSFEGIKAGRYFTYLTEESFKDLLKNIPEVHIEKIWITGDVRIERGEEQWLNILLRKQA